MAIWPYGLCSFFSLFFFIYTSLLKFFFNSCQQTIYVIFFMIEELPIKTLGNKVPLKVLLKQVPLEIILQALNIFGRIKSI